MDVYKMHAHNRSVGWSTWHIQWCTKYRYKIFGSKERREICKVLLHEAAKKHKFEVLDCEVDIDHVHVLVSLPLTMSPLLATQYLKGISSKGIFLLYPEMHKLYRRGHLWSPGKFVGSIGHITLEKAKTYLEAHHAKTIDGIPAPSVSEESPEGRAFRPGRMSICTINSFLVMIVHSRQGVLSRFRSADPTCGVRIASAPLFEMLLGRSVVKI